MQMTVIHISLHHSKTHRKHYLMNKSNVYMKLKSSIAKLTLCTDAKTAIAQYINKKPL